MSKPPRLISLKSPSAKQMGSRVCKAIERRKTLSIPVSVVPALVQMTKAVEANLQPSPQLKIKDWFPPEDAPKT